MSQTDNQPREAATFLRYEIMDGQRVAVFAYGVGDFERLGKHALVNRLRERFSANLPTDETARALRNWPEEKK